MARARIEPSRRQGLAGAGWRVGRAREQAVALERAGRSEREQAIALERAGCTARDQAVALEQRARDARKQAVALERTGRDPRERAVAFERTGRPARAQTVVIEQAGDSAKRQAVAVEREWSALTPACGPRAHDPRVQPCESFFCVTKHGAAGAAPDRRFRTLRPSGATAGPREKRKAVAPQVALSVDSADLHSCGT